MNTPLAIVVLVALISMASCEPINEREIKELSKLRPCINNQAGTRVKHPSNDHKFLRCVSRDSFWIETCPDNLFYNAELDLCDWSTISLTTTTANDVVVKFRPILFRNNKTVKFIRRPVDMSRVSVKITPDTEIFPDQEDIIDTLTPTKFETVRRPTEFVAKPATRHFESSNFGRFNHINNNNVNSDGVFSISNNNVGSSSGSFINNNDVGSSGSFVNHNDVGSSGSFVKVNGASSGSFINNNNLPRRDMVFEEVPVTTRRMFTTTTEEPIEFITTTHRPITTTTERPVEIVEPVRHFEKVEDSHSEESEENKDTHSEESEENKDKPVLFRKNQIVTSTKPTFHRRRPVNVRPVVEQRVEEVVPVESIRRPIVEEVVPVRTQQRVEEVVPVETIRQPIVEEVVPVRTQQRVEEVVPVESIRHKVVEEVVPVETIRQPVVEEVVPVRTEQRVEEVVPVGTEQQVEEVVPVESIRRPKSKINHGVISKSQLLEQLAEEMPGTRVVSFNGKPINAQL